MTMNHDPFQTYQTLGAYPGVTPFGLPYTAFQPNPAFGGYGINPQQSLNPLTAGLQNPLQNPLLQNPLLQHQLAQLAWQNQLLAASLQNPLLANHGWPQQQQQFGYPQQQQQFPYPLAPQSPIGAGGIGQPFGQIHPLAQLALRQAAGYGISPYAGGF